MGLPLLTSVTAGLRWPPETFAVQLQVHAHKLYAVYNLTQSPSSSMPIC